MPRYVVTFGPKVLVSWQNRRAKWERSGAIVFPTRAAAMALVRRLRLAWHPGPVRAYRARRSDLDPATDDHGWLD